MRYFTPSEDEKIRRMYQEYYLYDEIAKAVKRSVGSLQQRIARMKLPPRDRYLTLMVYTHGREILKYGLDRETIKKNIKDEADKRRADREQQNRIAIKQLKCDLRTLDRTLAMRRAKDNGGKLTDIGKVVGMTKQGVSWALKTKTR